MRCPITFAEIKEGPNGLECVECGRLFEPVENDENDVEIATGPDNRRNRLMIAVGSVLAIAIFIWGIVSFAPSQTSNPNALVESTALTRGQTVFLKDETGVVFQTLRPLQTEDVVELLRDKSCQTLSVNRADAFDWLNLAGEPIGSMRPVFPGNWRLHQVCPLGQERAVFATFLNDGVAVSQTDGLGELLWTQLVAGETIEMVIDSDRVLVLTHDKKAGFVSIRKYTQDGREAWRQQLSANGGVERFHVSKTGLDDFLVAWQDSPSDIQISIVSETGILLQESRVAGLSQLPVQDVIQDDLGGTLVVQGEDRVAAQIISPSGETISRTLFDEAAQPIGALSNGDGFLIFAAADDKVLIWGLDQAGGRSEQISVVLAEPVDGGDIQRINAVEAILSVVDQDGQPIEIVVDLRRLNNALVFETANELDEAIQLDLPTQSAFEINEDAIIQTRVTPSAEGNVSQRASLPQEQPNDIEAQQDDPQNQEAVVINSSVVDADILLEAEQAVDVLRSSETDATAAQITQARCRFSCLSSDENAAEYVLMQTVDLNEGERLADVVLRLNDAHVSLCAISGGAPVAEFTRECDPG